MIVYLALSYEPNYLCLMSRTVCITGIAIRSALLKLASLVLFLNLSGETSCPKHCFFIYSEAIIWT